MRTLWLGALFTIAACGGPTDTDTATLVDTDDLPGGDPDSTDTTDTTPIIPSDSADIPWDNTGLDGDTGVVDTSSGNDTDDTYRPAIDTDDTSETGGTGGGGRDTDTGADCDFGLIPDCSGTCYEVSRLGDGYCDDGISFPSDFNCIEFNFDQGDCTTDTGMPTSTECPLFIAFNTQSFASEMSYEVQDAFGNVVTSGPPITMSNSSSYDFLVTLPDGDYTFFMIDSWGDGWNGGNVNLQYLYTGNNIMPSNQTITSGSLGSFEFTVDCPDPPTDTATEDTAAPEPVQVDCDNLNFTLSVDDQALEVGVEVNAQFLGNVLDAPFGSFTAGWGGTITNYQINTAPYVAADWEWVTGSYALILQDEAGDGWGDSRLEISDATSGEVLYTFGSGFQAGSNDFETFFLDCLPRPEPVDTSIQEGCVDGTVVDCDGVCWPASLLGDGFCDDGTTFNANFDCATQNFDEGDCASSAP